jgi:hypothetical protein
VLVGENGGTVFDRLKQHDRLLAPIVDLSGDLLRADYQPAQSAAEVTRAFEQVAPIAVSV